MGPKVREGAKAMSLAFVLLDFLCIVGFVELCLDGALRGKHLLVSWI